MTQYLMFRVLSFLISVFFISFCFYFFHAKLANYKSEADTRTPKRFSTFIIFFVEVCLVSTLLYYSVLLMIGALKECIEKIKTWLIVVVCGILYYILATPITKQEMFNFTYMMIAFVSWVIVFMYYYQLTLQNNSQVLITLPEPGPPPSDDIHEFIITNDPPPAYNTLKHFEESPPPSYVSTINDSSDTFMEVSN